MDRLGWITIPPAKGVIDGLDESIESALVNLRLLRGTEKSLPRNNDELKKLLTDARRTIRKVTDLHEDRHQLVLDQARQSELLESLAIREKRLDAVLCQNSALLK